MDGDRVTPDHLRRSGLTGALLRLVRHASLYGAADLLALAAALLTVPLITRRLTPHEYGLVVTAEILVSLLSAVFTLGLAGAVGRFYIDFSGQSRREYLGSIWVFVTMLNLLLAATLALLLNAYFDFFMDMPPLFGQDPSIVRFILLASVLWVFFLSSPPILSAAAQMEGKANAVTIIRVTEVATYTCGIVGLVALGGRGLAAVFAARLLAAFCAWTLSVAMLRHRAVLTVDPKHLKESLRFSLPLVPHVLTRWTMNYADLLMLQYLTDATRVGIYSLGYRVGSMLNPAVSALTLALQPIFYKLSKGDARDRQILTRLVTYFVFSILALGAMLVSYSTEIIQLLAPREYWQAVNVVPLIVVSMVFRGLYSLATLSLTFMKKTALVLWSSAGAAAVNIGLNVVLIPRFDIMGAAYATLAAFATMSAIAHWYASQELPIPWERRRLILVTVVLCGTAVAAMTIKSGSIWLDVMFKACILLVSIPILTVLGVPSPAERSYVLKFAAAGAKRLRRVAGVRR